MCRLESFTTRSMAPQDRLQAWGRSAWASVGGLEVYTLTPGEIFEGEVTSGLLGPLRLCRIRVGRHRIERTAELIRSDDRDLLQVVFPLAGSIYFRQRDTQVILGPGQWCIYDTSAPYRAVTCARAELLIALVPRTRLAAPSIDPSCHVLQPRSTHCGASQVLFRSLISALDVMSAIATQSAEELGACLVEIMRIALLEKASGCGSIAPGETPRERIESFVRTHLRDPDLSIEKIAANLRCTKRYLHKVFSKRGETLSQYIWSLRLECCAADLTNPRCADKSITELSYDWGFSDSAHFSRMFKIRFGVPPRTYRAMRTERSLSPAA